MRDVGHCMMPYDGTDEFEAFYDFSRLYRDLPKKTLAITSKAEDKKANKSKEGDNKEKGDDEEESDDWATEDEESADEIEEADPAEEEDSESFEVISKSKGNTTESFTLINKTEQDTRSFEVIEASESSIAGEEDSAAVRSISSQYSGLNAALAKRKGKTRQEAFNALNIEKVELLDTGELRLPSGKIIGHRDYRHIYRQRNRLPDEREAVVINKLALEYRRMKHGGDGTVMVKQLDPEARALQKNVERGRDFADARN
jgi:hypothetical protein